MPTYHEIMTADLSALTTAADRWEGMAGEFAKQETAYRRDVHGIAMGRTWTGLSAQAASARFDVTLGEFQHAQTEAKAVASLLRDAHTQFVDLRGKLRTVHQEALAAGMAVSPRGRVAPDPDAPRSSSARPGAPGPAAAAAAAAVQTFQDRIDKAVRDVTDADTGVRIALAAVTVDADGAMGGRGFNGRALGDVETYEARTADRVLERLSRGGRLSPAERAELARAFRDNAADPAFSRTLLDDLGAAGTIRLTDELNDLIHVRGGPAARGCAEIETGLADSLASATKDTGSAWYRRWRTAMRHAGADRRATDVQGARLDKAVGYQSLATLLQNGHGYSRGMLEDLADDMIAAERRTPDVWRLKGAYAGRRDGWFANDPVDAVLGVMSRDPATAAHYLDSGDHLTYLMKDRDWNVTLHERGDWKSGGYTAGLDDDDRAGLGAALRAAATGIDPSSPHPHYAAHTASNQAVLRAALAHLADQGDDFPASLRRPMADILVNHGATVHAAMSEVDISRSPLRQDQLFEAAKQISKDEDAYNTLNGGLNQAMVTALHGDRSHPTEPLLRAGRTVGFLEEARVQAQGDPATAAFATKPLFDRAIGYIPVVSGDVQQGFDYVTGKWLEDEQERLDKKQADDNYAAYDTRNGQLMGLANEWRKAHPGSGESAFDAKTEIGRSAQDGAVHARGVSGEPQK
ncbi:hypothetical protein [Streptomyces sp. NPDC046985]|uniref:hypothetical protein n=1 Tax=Streptomyces sp. NPDC046985 TaxID=3155377 RepID=UPI0033FB0E97